MKRIDIDFKNYIGQGENSDLLVSVVEFDRKYDFFFGIDYEKGEKEISKTEDYIYPGLEDSALLTSYLDYFQIYEDIEEGETLVDLGAGYCRGSMLFERLGSKRCISIECERSRTQAALKIVSKDIIIGDLLDSKLKLPKAKNYFIYLPQGPVLYETLKKIISQKIEATFYVIESHGDLIDYFFMHSKLFDYIGKPFKTSLPRHNPSIYKFKSKIIEKKDVEKMTYKENLALWHLYNYDQKVELRIESNVPGQEKKLEWTQGLKGSTLIKYNNETSIYLENPARVLQLGTQDEILKITR